MNERQLGIIQTYRDDRGFGFLVTGESRWFFHVRDCCFLPKVGQRVTFVLGEGLKGPAALHVKLVDALDMLAGGAQ